MITTSRSFRIPFTNLWVTYSRSSRSYAAEMTDYYTGN